jgi:hypothetical protein
LQAIVKNYQQSGRRVISFMAKPKTDKAREQRIAMEVVADCHDAAEQMN